MSYSLQPHHRHPGSTMLHMFVGNAFDVVVVPQIIADDFTKDAIAFSVNDAKFIDAQKEGFINEGIQFGDGFFRPVPTQVELDAYNAEHAAELVTADTAAAFLYSEKESWRLYQQAKAIADAPLPF